MRKVKCSFPSVFLSCKRKLHLAMLACSPLLLAPAALAAPEGGRVTGGGGSIVKDGRVTSIEQESDRLAVDWDSFDLSEDEVVNYLQPGSDSLALNRILSANGSRIRGQINANGHVLLINPNGVVFGENAQVNVGGLVASGLDINAESFMKGDLTFSSIDGTLGEVVNQGVIQAATGGSVSLMGRRVRNAGLIRAELGAVKLAAGNQAVLTFDSEGLMGVRVTESVLQDELGVEPALSNQGEINAEGGRVLLTAATSRDVFSQAVNAGDMQEARSVVMHDDGSFTLGAGADAVNTGDITVSGGVAAGSAVMLGDNVTQEGSIEANSESGHAGFIELHSLDTTLLSQASTTEARASGDHIGGQVNLLGRQVGLVDSSVMDVSGGQGGGKVYLGGDYQGDNPMMPNAHRTIAGSQTTISANALSEGDGGRAIIWSDHATRFSGNLEGRGASDGVGGFAEISGKDRLGFRGGVDLSGPGGVGTLLLDPDSIFIRTSGEEITEGVDFSEGSGEMLIDPESIVSILEGDEGSGNVTLQANENISVNHDLETDSESGGNLSLHSGGDIEVSARISIGSGDIEFIAGHLGCDPDCAGNEIEKNITINSVGDGIETEGRVSFYAFDSIEIGDSISAGAIEFRAGNAITVDSNLTSEDGNIRLRSGDETLSDLDYYENPDNSFPQADSGDLTVSGALSSNGDDIFLDAPGDINLRATASTAGGDFTVGENQQPAGFYSLEYTDNDNDGLVDSSEIDSEGLIDTSSEEGGGQIKVTAGDVVLGDLSFGYPYNVDGDEEDPIHEQSGGVDVTGTGDVTFSHVIDFNDTGPRDSAGDEVHDGDDPTLVVRADGNIAFNADADSQNDDLGWEDEQTAGNAVIYDQYGDGRDVLDIHLTADANESGEGTVTVSGDIYTAGGNFEASGQSLDFSGMINTRYANALEDDEITVDDYPRTGEAQWSTGANVNLSASGAITLGDVVTMESCLAATTCTGLLSVSEREWEGSPNSPLSVSQKTDTALSIAGLTRFDVGEGTVTASNAGNAFSGGVQIDSAQDVTLHHNGDLVFRESVLAGDLTITSAGDIDSTGALDVGANSELAAEGDIELIDGDNRFAGKVSVSEAASVQLYSDSNLQLGSISTRGEDRDGGAVTIESGAGLTLEAGETLNSSGSEGEADGSAGFSGGAITLTAEGPMELDGALESTGGNGRDEDWRNDGEDGGQGGSVTIESYGDNVTLGSVQTSGGNGHSYDTGARDNDADGGDAGDLTVTANGTITLTQDLAARGGALSTNGSDEDLHNGTGGAIEFHGDVVLDRSALVIQSHVKPLEEGDNPADGAGINAGNVTFDGTVTAHADATTPALTLTGGDLTFEDTVGGSGDRPVGALRIDSYGDVDFQGDTAPSAGSIQIQALGDGEQTLALTDTDNHWHLRDGNHFGDEDAEADTPYIDFGGTDEEDLRFHGFHSLRGGSGEDHYTLEGHQSVAGDLDGGSDTGNTLTLGGDDNQWSLEQVDDSGAEGSVEDRVGGFRRIQALTGSGTDTLTGPDRDNRWTLDTDGDWSVAATDGSDPIVFSDMATLRGNDQADHFVLENSQSFEGELDGGSDAGNTLTLGGDDNQWSLDRKSDGTMAGSVEDRVGGFRRLQALTGSGSDALTGPNRENQWTLDRSGQWSVAALDGRESLTFSGMNTLTGNAQADHFTLENNQSFEGELDGGSDAGNTLTLGGDDNQWSLERKNDGTMAGAVEDRVGGFRRLQALTGSGSDALTGPDRENQWTLDIDGDWSVAAMDGSDPVVFSGMDTLTGNDQADHFVLEHNPSFDGELDGGAGADTLTIDSDGSDTVAWTLDGAGRGSVDDRLTRFTGIDELTGGEGDDIFTLANAEVRLDELHGGGGDNTLVNEGPAGTWTLEGPGLGRLRVTDGPDVRFTGLSTLTGSGADELRGGDADSRWLVTEDNAGAVGETAAAEEDYTDFSGMNRLTGRGADDVFILQSGGRFGGTIDGGAGDNTLTASGANDWVLTSAHDGRLNDDTAFVGMQTLNGGGEDNALTGPERDNQWTLTGAGTGEVQAPGQDDSRLSFTDMDRLNGHDQADTFLAGDTLNRTELTFFRRLSGGAGGDDELDLTGLQGGDDLSVALDATPSADLRIDGFETLRLSGTDTTLHGASDRAYRWEIDGENTGFVEAAQNPDERHTMDFEGVHNLLGGEHSDTFTVVEDGEITGVIDGGAGDGINLMDYSRKQDEVEASVGGDQSGITRINGVIGNNDGTGEWESRLDVGETDSTVRWELGQLSGVPERDGQNDGLNDGRVSVGEESLYFINFNDLEGGSGTDRVTLTERGRLHGTFDGGAGENILDATAAERAQRFNLAGAAEGHTHLVGFDELRANPDRPHRLIGPDKDNRWAIDGVGRGVLNEGLRFDGVHHLIAGAREDRFTLTGAGRVDRIEGRGAQEDNRLDIRQASEGLRLSRDRDSGSADVRFSGLGEVTGTAGDGHRLEGRAAGNDWALDGENRGTLNRDLAFSGLDILLGGADGDDAFVFTGEGALSGHLDGAGGENTVDLTGLDAGQDWTLATTDSGSADLAMLDIRELVAPSSARHRLTGTDEGNDWTLTGENRGRMNDLAFTGVGTLLGTEADDRFTFEAAGTLTGPIDGGGGAGENRVDLSARAQAEVSVGEHEGDLRRIDRLTGNRRQTTLIGLGEDNTWRLTDGDNAGTFNDRLAFTGVTDLVGDDHGNTFYLDGGRVTGTVTGGAGDDRVELHLAPGTQGALALDGGGGSDALWVTGGGDGYRSAYHADHDGGERLTYTGPGDDAYDVRFERLEQLRDDLVADRLRVNSSLEADRITLRDQSLQVEGLSELTHSHKANLLIAADRDDRVILDGVLELPGTLTLRNARVEQTGADGRLRARQLRLNGVERFGTDERAVATDVDQLSAETGPGGLFLDNERALELTRLDSRGPVSLRAEGALTSDADLRADQGATLESGRGDLRLSGDNRLSGPVALSAAHDLHLRQAQDLTLAEVDGEALTLDVRGDIDGTAPLRLERLSLARGDTVTLTHEDNRLDTLEASDPGQLTLHSASALRVDGVESPGEVTLSAPELRVSDTLDAGAIDLRATGDLHQNAELHSGAGARVHAGGDLRMSASARTDTGDALDYRAGDDLTLARLHHPDGAVRLRAGGSLHNALGDAPNVRAGRLTVEAGTGIGADQRLLSDVDALSVTNERGDVLLGNQRPVRLERLANNGSISFRNTGTVVLDGREGPVFDPGAGEAIAAGGTANANYDLGTLSVTVSEGDLLAEGPAEADRPDLVGRRGSLVVGGDIGSVTRPLVMYFRDHLFLEGLRSWPPVWGLERRPQTVENQSLMQLNQQVLTSAGEQMVAVESLEEVDPAIFTPIRNYSYDDVSILLPPDQRYERGRDEERYSLGE